MLQNVENSCDLIEKINYVFPIATFILGALLSRFSMSKAERVSAENAAFAMTKEMAAQQEQASQKLCQILGEYASRTGKPTLQEFYQVMNAASSYLSQQKIIADAILSNRASRVSRDGTLVPNLVECAERTIPGIYETLRDIAEQNGLPYPDTFKRENYQSIFDVVEKYGPRKPSQADAGGA